jgi:hypothetical protein
MLRMARVRFRLLSVLVVIVATVVACLSACSSRGLDYFHTVVDGQESVGISKRDTAVRALSSSFTVWIVTSQFSVLTPHTKI